MRVQITLACGECKRRNYITTKNKRNKQEIIELIKYLKFLQKQTDHKETK